MRYKSMQCIHCGMLGGEVGKVFYTLMRLSSNGGVKISGIDLAMKARVKYRCIYMHLTRLKDKGFVSWTTGKGGDFSMYRIKNLEEFARRGIKAQKAIDRILKRHQVKQGRQGKKTSRRAAQHRGMA